MKHRSIWFMAGAILLSGTIAWGWQNILAQTKTDEVKRAPGYVIDSRLNFRFDRAWVWERLIEARGIQALTGIKIHSDDHAKSCAAIGDAFTARWNESDGKLIVTAFERGRELRLVFESDASALQAWRFRLATAGEGTVMHYSIVTLEDPAIDAAGADERAEKIRAAVADNAVAFRKHAEPPPLPPKSH